MCMRTCIGGFCNRGRGVHGTKDGSLERVRPASRTDIAMWGFLKQRGRAFGVFGFPYLGTTMWLALLPVGFLAVAGFVGPYY